MDLTGKTALITGATAESAAPVIRGIAAAGASLALTGRNAQRLARVAADLGLADTALVLPADLARAEEVERLLDAVRERYGGVDVLVHLAGGWGGGQRLSDTALADWDAVMASNLHCAVLVCRGVAGEMALAGIAAERPRARQAAYNVAKAGLVALIASIAEDYKRQGVVANAISPSIIATDEGRRNSPEADHSRWVTPEQLAALVLFLLSEEAAGLNGANIPLYGRV
jgi:NAD(P)-dependent dehydrogenase (short-subunit alcohol dehydrogenase family)